MPELARWALDDIQQTLIIGGWIIQTTTDVRCHQWLRHTLKPPQKHSKPIERRGLTIGYDARFCFVAYEDLEQDEPGDTLTHTFTWTGWTICQTRWFYFWATIDGVKSPSTSGIFEKGYHPGDTLWLICHTPVPYHGTTYIDHTLWGSTNFKPATNFTITQVKAHLYLADPPKVPAYFRFYISPVLPDGRPVSGTIITSGELIDPPITADPQLITIPISPAPLDADTPYSLWGYPGHWKDNWPNVAGISWDNDDAAVPPAIGNTYRSPDAGSTWDLFSVGYSTYEIYGTLL